jgi:hypothetical protein
MVITNPNRDHDWQSKLLAGVSRLPQPTADRCDGYDPSGHHGRDEVVMVRDEPGHHGRDEVLMGS